MAKGKYEYWLSPDGLLQLEAWARDGLTDEQIANNLGIRRETLYAWKKNYPAINEALRKGKAVIDIEIENALIKRALGYEYQETKKVKGIDSDGCPYSKVVEITKQVVPDTTAQIFWLKNRKPKEWGGRSSNSLINDSGQCDSIAVKDILMDTIKLLANGEIEAAIANQIISACNAVLTSIRTDEQQKKIDELEKILNESRR